MAERRHKVVLQRPHADTRRRDVRVESAHLASLESLERKEIGVASDLLDVAAAQARRLLQRTQDATLDPRDIGLLRQLASAVKDLAAIARPGGKEDLGELSDADLQHLVAAALEALGIEVNSGK